jgi:hypothetical protein
MNRWTAKQEPSNSDLGCTQGKQHARVPRIPGALCGTRRPTRRSRCDSWQLFHLFDSAWGSGLKGRAWSLVARIDLGTNCSPSKLFSIV